MKYTGCPEKKYFIIKMPTKILITGGTLLADTLYSKNMVNAR